MKIADYGVDFASTRQDGLGIVTRFDMRFGDRFDHGAHYSVSHDKLTIPVHVLHLGSLSVRRPNLGSVNQANQLPKVNAKLKAAAVTTESGRLLSIVLSDFEDANRNVRIGRPISLGSSFGLSPDQYEGYEALCFSATEAGNCQLEGRISHEDGTYDFVPLARHGQKRVMGDPADAFRFGSKCIDALSQARSEPIVQLIGVAG